MYIYIPLCRYWIALYRYVLVFIVPHVDIELEDNKQFISNIPSIDNFFNFGPILMKFSPKCRVWCLELKYASRQLYKGRGAAEMDKRGGPPLCIGLAGALYRRLKTSLIIPICFLTRAQLFKANDVVS